MNINHDFTSIRQIQESYLNNKGTVSRTQREQPRAFQEILNEKAGLSNENLTCLKFSKHADARMADRNINLTQEQLDRLEKGTQKAGEKGIQESLVIMDNLSFIVNVKNRTVITAMDHTGSGDNVYTNIDGAVII